MDAKDKSKLIFTKIYEYKQKINSKIKKRIKNKYFYLNNVLINSNLKEINYFKSQLNKYISLNDNKIPNTSSMMDFIFSKKKSIETLEDFFSNDLDRNQEYIQNINDMIEEKNYFKRLILINNLKKVNFNFGEEKKYTIDDEKFKDIYRKISIKFRKNLDDNK